MIVTNDMDTLLEALHAAGRMLPGVVAMQHVGCVRQRG
jgi:hypothetical protein